MPSIYTPNYWFRAKRYGWGWGLPCAWQGWVVLSVYLTFIICGIPFIDALIGAISFLVYSSVLTVAFVGVCRLTGEPPHWSWGHRRS